MHWFLNTHPILLHLACLLTCCFNFWFVLNILCKKQTIFIWTSVVNWSSVFCMFNMALTRPSLTMQLRSGVEIFAHVSLCVDKRWTLRATIVTIFSHGQEMFQFFVKCDTSFRFFFWKLPQILTSNFLKVVRQHTEGIVGSIIWVLLEISVSSSERILKIRYELTKLSPWVCCRLLLFGDIVLAAAAATSVVTMGPTTRVRIHSI